MSYIFGFTVETEKGMIKISNQTDLNLFISIKPIPPHRKYTKIMLVAPHTFKISLEPYLFDLKLISFSLEEPK
jgi:hypothetical protein